MGVSRDLTARQLAGQPDHRAKYARAPPGGHNGGPPLEQIDYSRLAPLRRWCKENGFSPTTVYNWETAGHVILVRVGHRTHIVLDTLNDMIRRLAEQQGGRRLPSSNPKAKARQEAAPAIAERSAAPQSRGARET